MPETPAQRYARYKKNEANQKGTRMRGEDMMRLNQVQKSKKTSTGQNVKNFRRKSKKFRQKSTMPLDYKVNRP